MIRGGPLSVAEYMQEVLTNPNSGYYMKRDVFGSRGDFTTSPEISQMFGEMLGIWCVVVWQSLGRPSCLSLVELGPGRGTLMADLLRGTAAFTHFSEALRVHLVEVSPYMRQQQWAKLHCSSHHDVDSTAGGQQPPPPPQEISGGIIGITNSPVEWHASLDAVPAEGPAIYIAHEFLDALPVHQFVRDQRRGWLEVMVDTVQDEHSQSEPLVSSSSSSSDAGIPLVQQAATAHPTSPTQQQQQQSSMSEQPQRPPSADGVHLRYVLSPSPTPAGQLLVPRRLAALQQQQEELPDAIEIGAHAMAVSETLARRIAAGGGAALLIDYGRNAPYSNSLTAIRAHQGVHPLSQPGTADLSAWVDFSAMRLAAEEAAEVEQATAAAAAAAAAGGKPAAATTAAAAAGPAGPGVDVHGPVTQADLLHSLGIQARLQALAEQATRQEEFDALVSGYKRLVDTEPGGMGAAYLALAITQKGLAVPAGFDSMQQEQGHQEQQ